MARQASDSGLPGVVRPALHQAGGGGGRGDQARPAGLLDPGGRQGEAPAADSVRQRPGQAPVERTGAVQSGGSRHLHSEQRPAGLPGSSPVGPVSKFCLIALLEVIYLVSC